MNTNNKLNFGCKLTIVFRIRLNILKNFCRKEMTESFTPNVCLSATSCLFIKRKYEASKKLKIETIKPIDAVDVSLFL